MKLTDLLAGSQNNPAINQLARQFGLSDAQIREVIGQVAPVLGQGLARNTRASGGLDALIGALQRGSHQRYVDQPEVFSHADTVRDGNGILGHILGSKDVSRALAGKAGASTGISPEIIKQLLPLIASLVMGSLSRQTSAAPQGNPMSDMLGSLLDRDGDGSALDDLIGMAGRFLGR
jgi:hypothetical protein